MFEKYPDRFLLGIGHLVNERWSSYGATWPNTAAGLNSSRPAVAKQIAHGNAKRLFAEK